MREGEREREREMERMKEREIERVMQRMKERQMERVRGSNTKGDNAEGERRKKRALLETNCLLNEFSRYVRTS